jgi:dihydroflavonol-4-reductase
MKSKVLITGGTGFIGSRLALRALHQGHAVRVLAQTNTPAELDNRKLIETNGGEVVLESVLNREKMSEVVQGIDVVYHLAAAQHEANVPDQKFWDVNVTGTKNILEASVQSNVKRLVHGSTIGVYGSSLEGSISETSPMSPDNIYGVTKLEGEKLVSSFKEKLPVVIIRIPETYGPGDRRLLKLFKAISKKVFFMIGSGKNRHHLIYIDDLIQGLFLAATTEEGLGKVFLLSGKESITTNDMVQVIAEELSLRIPKIHAPLSFFLFAAVIFEAVFRPLGIQPPIHRRRIDFFKKSFVFSQKASGKDLRFSANIDFVSGIKETAKWYRETGLL